MSLIHFFLRLFGERHRDDAASPFVFIATCGLLLLLAGCQHNETEGTTEEKAYDQLQLNGRWNEIVKKNEEKPAQSLACKKVVALALLRVQGSAANAQKLMSYCLEDSRDVLTSQTAALMMSDVYIQLGMVAMAQRAAFDAMVKTDNPKNCERPLRRLTEAALVMGNNDLVLKYASLLEDFSSSRKWARQMAQMARHPELIGEQSAYGKLKKQYEKTDDGFFL